MAGSAVTVSVLGDIRDFTQKMSETQEKVTGTFSKIAGAVGASIIFDKLKDLGVAAFEFATDVGDSLDAINDQFGDAADGAAKAAKTIVGAGFAESATMIAEFGKVMQNTLGQSQEEASKTSAALAQGAADIAANYDSSAEQASAAMSTFLLGKNKALGKLLGMDDDQIKSRLKVLMKEKGVTEEQARLLFLQEQSFKNAGGAQADAAGTLSGAMDKLNKLFENIGVTVVQNLQPAIEGFSSFITEHVSPAIEAFNSWAEENPDLVRSVAVGIGVLVAAAAALAVGMAALNVVMLVNPFVLIATAIVALIAGLIYFFTQTETGKRLWQNFTKALTDIWQKFTTWIKGVWDTIVGFFRSAAENVKKAWTAVSDWFSGLPNKIKGFFSGAVQWLSRAGENILEGLLDGIEAIFGKDVANWFRNLKTALSAFIKDPGGWLVKIGQYIIDGLLGGVKAIFGGGVADFFRSVESKVKGFLKDPGGWLVSTGRRVIEGLWSGINDKVSWIKNKISGFVGSVERWFKDFFGINSPSKRMRDKIGRWLPEGIAEAFDRDSSVTRALARFSAGMEADFNPHLAMAAPQTAQAGGRVYEIHIQAVAPNAEVGRAVVKAITDFERSGGRR
jgi:phage-related protein